MIKENAPDGATHYAYGDNGCSLHYLKKINGDWHKSHFDSVYNRRIWVLFIFISIDIKPL